MIKISKQKILATTVLLAVLMISSVFASLLPSVYAQKVNTSIVNGLTVINQVADIDLTKYIATPTLEVNGPSLGALPTENIRYALSGNGSRIDILDTFANGSLEIMDVLENDGSPHMITNPSNVVSMAKSFLLSYQSYSANAFYGELASMLSQANEYKNSSMVVGNIRFDTNVTYENSTMSNTVTFTWSYASNGINVATKCLSIGYKNGFLKDFIDTWKLYPIGSTTFSLSEQQAEAIAMKNAQIYSWKVGLGSQTATINNFNVTKPMAELLLFGESGNATGARSNDPLTLYPMWSIGVGLDKYYPGNVYGINVDIWADTGQVKDVHEVFSTLPAPANDTASIADSSINSQASTSESNMFTVILLVSFVAGAIIVVPLRFCSTKKAFSFSKFPKLRKLTAIVLCMLMSLAAFTALVSAVPTVNAINTANIWGDNSNGSPYLFHTSTEITSQEQLSTYIQTSFANDQYASNNYEQILTTKNDVLTCTSADEQNSSSVETVYFDHGVGMPGAIPTPYQNEWHYMLCTDLSQSGDPSQDVFDYQLYDNTITNNYFTYISTCYSGSLLNGNQIGSYTGEYGLNNNYNAGESGNIIGMPFAWTHQLPGYISSDGYTMPDSGKYVYLGFLGGSAALCQSVDNRQSGSTTYYTFVSDFFNDLLNSRLTVNQALDDASYQAFTPENFAETALCQGFTAIWPNEDGSMHTGGGEMMVFGNGNLYMWAGGPDYVSTPSVSGDVSGNTGDSLSFSASAMDPYGYGLTYTFNWGDGSNPTVTGNPTGVTHSWASAGAYTVTVTTQSQATGIVSSPAYYPIVITNPQPPMVSLTVDAECSCELQVSMTVDSSYIPWLPYTIQVTEGAHTISTDSQSFDPNLGVFCDFYCFDSNGNCYYSNPATIPISGDTTLYAIYYPEW